MTPTTKINEIPTPEASDCAFIAVDVDSTSTLPTTQSDSESHGEPTPSLASQIASQRNLLAIATKQLGIVYGAVAIATCASESSRLSLKDTFRNMPPMLALVAGYSVTLGALHFARAKAPRNWIVLVLFTVCAAMTFIMIDVSTGYPIVHYLLLYILWCVASMLAGAGLSTTTTGSWWCGLSIRAPDLAAGEQRRILSPIVAGVAGFAVGLVVIAIVSLELDDSSIWNGVPFAAFAIGAFFVEFAYTKAKDEFMRGVVYLHANLLVSFVLLFGILSVALRNSQ